MRLLSLNIQDSFIDYLENNKLYICDKAEDFNDAIYHSEVRFYNLVLIKSDDFKSCKNLLHNINAKQCAVFLLSKNLSKKEKIYLHKNGVLQILEDVEKDILLMRIQNIHYENFTEKYLFRELIKLDRINKNILDKNENKLQIKGKSFDVLSYLIKNRDRSVISKDELVNALWEEPELICNNVVEVNINQIRNELRKNFNIDFITTIRNRGYKINSHNRHIN